MEAVASSLLPLCHRSIPEKQRRQNRDSEYIDERKTDAGWKEKKTEERKAILVSSVTSAVR